MSSIRPAFDFHADLACDLEMGTEGENIRADLPFPGRYIFELSLDKQQYSLSKAEEAAASKLDTNTNRLNGKIVGNGGRRKLKSVLESALKSWSH